MKKFISSICSLISHILLLPCLICGAVACCWYCIPESQSTWLGIQLLNLIGTEGIFWATIGSGIGIILFSILCTVFKTIKKCTLRNMYTHFITWLLAIIVIGLVGYTFAVSSLVTYEFELTLIRRIGILVCTVLMFIYAIIGNKVRTLINRRLQAYDTALEMTVEGRSSVFWINILKAIDFVLPELIVFVLLCFCFSFDIAKYFIIIICSFILPIIGNIICDYRIRQEAKYKKIAERETLVNEVANAVIDAQQQQH